MNHVFIELQYRDLIAMRPLYLEAILLGCDRQSRGVQSCVLSRTVNSIICVYIKLIRCYILVVCQAVSFSHIYITVPAKNFASLSTVITWLGSAFSR